VNLFLMTFVVLIFTMYVFMTVKNVNMLVVPTKRQVMWDDLVASLKKQDDTDYTEFLFNAITAYYWVKTAFVVSVVLIYLKPWPLAVGGAGALFILLAASASQVNALKRAAMKLQDNSPLTTPMIITGLAEDSIGAVLLGVVLAQAAGMHL